MIPKTIHYCWFGGNPLDEKALKCIESWKRFFPDYEIIQWNESNFDVTQVSFMKKAYDDRKWAFVSDVARLIVVYNHGGIYFDTDVEVIRSYQDILHDDTVSFWGMEQNKYIGSGLGFGCIKKHPFIKKHLDIYEEIDYDAYKTHLSDIACPIITTTMLEKEGFVREDKRQRIMDLDIYPSTYFSPIDYNTGKLKKTKYTHSIHWYSASWQDQGTIEEQKKLRFLCGIFGKKIGNMMYGVATCIHREGICKYITTRIKKYARRDQED